MLTLDDNVRQNRVCVVRQELADKRNLKIGDVITITLKDLEMYVYGRTYPDWEPNLEDAPTFTEDYTVAGIIYSLQDNSRQEEYTEIYIPL